MNKILSQAFCRRLTTVARPPRTDIIKNANKKYGELPFVTLSVQEKLAITCRMLDQENHDTHLSGQVTARGEEPGTMYTQRYGRGLEEITPNDYLLINEELEVLEGDGVPNPANNFHLWVYRARPEINSIIHTHPPHVNALCQVGVRPEPNHMDHMCFYNDIEFLPKWPGVPFGDEEGEIITNALNGTFAVLLANHGQLVAGTSIEQAAYRGFFIERMAQAQLWALQTQREILKVDEELAQQAHDWRLSDGPVRAHFNYFARRLGKKALSEIVSDPQDIEDIMNT